MLKQLITRLRRRLALMLYPVDPLELVRHQLHIAPRNPKHIEDLPKEEQEQMLAEAHMVCVNPSFKFVINYLISDQREETVERAANMDYIWFGRGSINGNRVVEEEFERLSDLHKENILAGRVANYDRFSVV